MKQLIFIFFLFIISLSTFGQKYLIDLRIGELKYENESIIFNKPLLISATTNNITPIITIGTTKNYEFGMRVEFLKSQFPNTNGYVVGMAYYIKKKDKWEEINSFFQPEDIYPFADRKKYNNNDNIVAGISGEEPKYEIRLRYDFFVK